MARYQEHLQALRRLFPQPVSDPVHDGYVAFSVLRALDQIDAIKSHAPILGQPTEPDFTSAREARLDEDGCTLEAVIPRLVHYLHGMFIWGHPRSQINVVPNASLASIIGALLPLIYNPNLVSEESARLFSQAEVEAAAMSAGLVGYDPRAAGGIFTFGGTGTLLYGGKIGLEKALPGASATGVRGAAVLIASRHSHHACLNVASWLGIGQDNVIAVEAHDDNSIRLDAAEDAIRAAIADGKRIAGIVATMGSTDAFGMDDLEGLRKIRDRAVEEYRLDYRPHIHADAVIGWAWAVFNGYDFVQNDLGFRGRTLRSLAAAQNRIQHLALADSIGIDFHKTGYTPYISSLVLAGDARDFRLIARDRAAMPYLYQSGEHHPGMFTLETSRSAVGPMAALANLLLFGKTGYRTLLGHAVEMAEVLRERIESHPHLTVLNGGNVGPVTLFRAYPDGVNTFTVKDREQLDAGYRSQVLAHNAYNRQIFERVHRDALAGRGVVLSLTDCYRPTAHGDPIVALKSYVLSPFVDESRMESVFRHVLEAREPQPLAPGGAWHAAE